MQFKWRNHDPQIGRFIEIDPLANDYVYNSTYAFSENKVIAHIELEGLEATSFLKRAIATEFQSTANQVDNLISRKREIETSVPISREQIGPVTFQMNAVTTGTATTTLNTGGFMKHLLYNNQLSGSNENLTKTTYDTKVAVKNEVVADLKGASGKYSVSIDNTGVVTKEAEAALNIKRIASTLSVNGSSSSNGDKKVLVGLSPLQTQAKVIGVYESQANTQSVGIGYCRSNL